MLQKKCLRFTKYNRLRTWGKTSTAIILVLKRTLKSKVYSDQGVLEQEGRFLQVSRKLEIIIWILEGCRWIVQWITLIRLLTEKINRTKCKVPKIIAKSYRTGLADVRHAERFPWHATFTAVPIFIAFVRSASLYCEVHVYMYLSDCLETVYELLYMNCFYYQITLRMKHFYTNRNGAKCWLDIYHWGKGLAVTGWIRDIGQNVLLSYFKTGSSSSSSYFHISFLIAFLEKFFISNIIIVIYINYIIVICINENNAVINNNCERIQDLILFFSIPMDTRKDIFEIYWQFGHTSSKSFAKPDVEQKEGKCW